MGKYQARIAAAAICGQPAEDVASHRIVPRVTFTDPQVCAVGLTFAQARADGLRITAVTTRPATFLAPTPRATGSAAPAS